MQGRHAGRWSARTLVLFVAAAFCTIMFLAWHAVDTAVSDEDRTYIPKYLVGISTPPAETQRTYRAEIKFIDEVQKAVLRIASGKDGVPLDAEREPRDVFEAKTGLCYDRSRVIEKILRYAGFEVRHVSIYSIKRTGSATRSLLTAQVPSHAVSEVLTKNGWLVVDSNDAWLALDESGSPISIGRIKAAADGRTSLRWRDPVPTPLYREPFTWVYGLYSRHGRFYKPYGFFPDVNYSELFRNVW
jgi:hypothetical protein